MYGTSLTPKIYARDLVCEEFVELARNCILNIYQLCFAVKIESRFQLAVQLLEGKPMGRNPTQRFTGPVVINKRFAQELKPVRIATERKRHLSYKLGNKLIHFSKAGSRVQSFSRKLRETERIEIVFDSILAHN